MIAVNIICAAASAYFAVVSKTKPALYFNIFAVAINVVAVVLGVWVSTHPGA